MQCSSSIWRFVSSFSTWQYLFHTGYHSVHLFLLLFFTRKKVYSKYMFYYKKLTLMKMRYSLLARVLWHPPLLKYNNPSDRQQTWLFGKQILLNKPNCFLAVFHLYLLQNCAVLTCMQHLKLASGVVPISLCHWGHKEWPLLLASASKCWGLLL